MYCIINVHEESESDSLELVNKCKYWKFFQLLIC